MKSNPSTTARLGLITLLASLALALFLLSSPGTHPAHAQQPTGSVATVTGTPVGATVIVYTERTTIGVFEGPSAYLYPQVGILISGEEAPALGYSQDGEWIKIVYLGTGGGTGWVYAPFVAVLRGSELPVLLNPPTATPRTTPTIDPTRAAAFGLEQTAVRLPTFTEPAPIEVPEFDTAEGERAGIPAGLILLALLLVGVLGAVFLLLRGR